jgi:hypothetical protein
MDLVFPLKLGFTGLAYEWESDTNPTIPEPIDPNPTLPNESPFGTPEERQKMLDILNPSTVLKQI